MLVIVSLLIYPACFSAEPQEKPTISWVVFDQAPYWFSKSPLKGQGLGEKLLEVYKERLPQFTHKIVLTNVARYIREAQKPATCVPFAWISEIEAGMKHSRPITIEPPMGVFVSKNQQAKIQVKDGWINLIQTLNTTNLNFGYINKFDYGSTLNKFLEDNNTEPNIHKQYAATGEINLKLLTLNRLDMIIGMPVQLKKEQVLGNHGKYIFYNIDEINNYIKIYSHCSDDVIGNIAIAEIEKILSDEFLTKLGEDYFEWYKQNETFKMIFNDVVIRRNERPNVYTKFQ